MSGHDANANGAPGSSASADVLDARETMADGPKRLMRLVRAPFARAAPQWKSFVKVAFACPNSPSEASARARRNVCAYGYCYLALGLGVAAFNCLSRWFTVVLLVGAFMGHHFVARVRRVPIEIGGKRFMWPQSSAVAAATAVLFGRFIYDVFFVTFAFAFAFACAHPVMACRRRNRTRTPGRFRC